MSQARLSTVKAHKTTIVNKEREVLAREQAIIEKEQHINTLFTQKDQEIATLQHAVAQLQNQQNCQLSQRDVEVAVKQAIARREEELRVLVMKREEEVASAMSKREEEIMEAVRRRETEVCEAWVTREAEIRKEVEQSIKAVEERIEWIAKRENELKIEEARLDGIREDVEDKVKKLEESVAKGAYYSQLACIYFQQSYREEGKDTSGRSQEPSWTPCSHSSRNTITATQVR